MKNNKGFTLVELLAVIVILGIIMIIAIPSVLNSMQIAKEKTFGEYVTKVYTTAQSKRMEDLLAGKDIKNLYNVETDLDLTSTGDFKGYVLFVPSDEGEDVYISLTNGEYYTATQLGEDESSIVDYINYSEGGEPVAANSTERFSGKNVFLRGNKTTIDPPPTPEEPEYVDIKPNTTIKDDFEGELKKFYNLAKNDFEEATTNNKAERFNYTCSEGHDHGYVYQKAYDYATLTGDTNANNKGFIVFYKMHITSDLGNSMELNAAMVAYRNKNYHTATNFTYPIDQTYKKTNTIKLPVTFYGRGFDTIPYNVTYSTSNATYNQLEFTMDFGNVIMLATDYESASTGFKQIFTKHMPNITYTNNTNDDGLPSSAYNYNTYMNTYKISIKSMAEGIFNLLGVIPR